MTENLSQRIKRLEEELKLAKMEALKTMSWTLLDEKEVLAFVAEPFISELNKKTFKLKEGEIEITVERTKYSV